MDGAEVGRLVDEAAGRPTPLRPRTQPSPPAAEGDRTQELPDSPRPAWRER